MKWLVMIWVLSHACNNGHAGTMLFQQWSEFTGQNIVTYLKCSFKTTSVEDHPPPFHIGILDANKRPVAQVSYSTEYVKLNSPYSDRWEAIGHADGVFMDAYLTLINSDVSSKDGGEFICEARYKLENTNTIIYMNQTKLMFEVEQLNHEEGEEILTEEEVAKINKGYEP